MSTMFIWMNKGKYMYWKITPSHNSDADNHLLPGDTLIAHKAALEYAQKRLECAFYELQPGMQASITIELCIGGL